MINTNKYPIEEYKLLASYSDGDDVRKLYSLLATALIDDSWNLINLDKAQSIINEHFRFLKVFKRYSDLYILAKGKLDRSQEGFQLDGHTFKTLDEVEKALNNKAFL